MADLREKPPTAAKESSTVIDSATFAAHYRQVYPRMHLIATGIVGDRTHAHDIVQEAALIALKKSDLFVPGSNFSAWLAEIVRRCALNYARKIRTRRTSATDPNLLAQSQQAPPTSWHCGPIHDKTGTLLEFQADFDDATLQALEMLNHEPRCCLLLRVVQNLSYAEISQLLQIPEGTAMSHVHRSKRVLRQALTHDAIRPATPGEEP
jgi:RNA polymerase sigma-70 factor (ECF subfamily)